MSLVYKNIVPVKISLALNNNIREVLLKINKSLEKSK